MSLNYLNGDHRYTSTDEKSDICDKAILAKHVQVQSQNGLKFLRYIQYFIILQLNLLN